MKARRVNLGEHMPELAAYRKLTAAQGVKAVAGAETDCSELQYISSAGLRVLLIMQKSLPGARVRLTGVNEVVREILETTGLMDIFAVEQQA